jgi:hypothetical protein
LDEEMLLQIKSYFIDLLNRLKEKSKDEIVFGLISGAKQGPPPIIFLVKMIFPSLHS